MLTFFNGLGPIWDEHAWYSLYVASISLKPMARAPRHVSAASAGVTWKRCSEIDLSLLGAGDAAAYLAAGMAAASDAAPMRSSRRVINLTSREPA